MKEYKYTINGNKYEVTIDGIVDNVANIKVNGEDYKVELEPEVKPEKPKVVVRPVVTPSPANSSKGRANSQDALKAPLPGVINEVKVNIGDEVKEGDTLVVLEAMKMANNLDAEKSGKVKEICVQPGQSVMEGDNLIVFE
ncbi:MAG: biotin/lipoyl-binding protein [Prevotella sp.]|nr:biotin/lipoyl-binding protein [Prevotella sp.]